MSSIDVDQRLSTSIDVDRLHIVSLFCTTYLIKVSAVSIASRGKKLGFTATSSQTVVPDSLPIGNPSNA